LRLSTLNKVGYALPIGWMAHCFNALPWA